MEITASVARTAVSGFMELAPSTGMQFRSYSTQPKPMPIRRWLASRAV